MQDDWQVAEGTGWVYVPGFGRINPRRDNEGGGRQFFTAYLDNNEYARATGASLTGGPQTWQFEFEEPFFLADRGDRCIEVEISLLTGGKYAVKYRPRQWPKGDDAAGGWALQN